MFCPKCGKEIADDAAICVGCGRAVQNSATISKIQIKRKFGWFGMLLSFSVLVDDTKIAKIAINKELEIDIKPGNHSIKVKQLFVGSKSLQFNNLKGESFNFECGSNAGFFTIFIPFVTLFRLNDCLYIKQI